MLRPALVLVGTASVVAGVDLAHKAAAGFEYLHARSGAYVVLVLGLTVLWAAAIVLTRSALMALCGGVASGGAIGNVASLAFWPGVPNPLEVQAMAFNLADVAVLGGFLLVAATATAWVRGERARLSEPLRLR
jgi:lipoprotein signal peptidase